MSFQVQDFKVNNWLQSAIADAERRGLPELKPLLEALARSTAALREQDAAARRDGRLETPGGKSA